LGPLFEAAYRFELGRRSRAFDRGKGVVTLDRPVVSVGNLSVGGTGKTPMVRRLVLALRDANVIPPLDPAIAMRGYASREGLSDEADEYRRTLDNVPVVAQPNRAQGLLDLFATDRGHDINCIVLDDGFQHRALARCFDLVLLDATRDPFADHLLPRGWLREGPDALRRAHAVAITRADATDPSRIRDIAANARRINPDLIIAAYRHAWTALSVHSTTTHASREESVTWLRAKRVGVACAIANPDALLAMVQSHTHAPLESSATIILPDHDAYDAPALKRVIDLSHTVDALLVTNKDWSKLARVRPELWGCPVVVPRVEMVPIPELLPQLQSNSSTAPTTPPSIEAAAIAAVRAFQDAHPDPSLQA
jgi:tetraacyldisaccharide 4'-kinase